MVNTLTYSSTVEGWVSFYSYYPDWIIGMNNYLYTFKGGDLYKHNVNDSRNTFYEQWWAKFPFPPPPPGPFVPTRVVSVFNDVPLENKLFKTINIQGDATWEMTFETDLQYSGYIQSSWFEKKEASYFAFIRNDSNGQFALRSLNGIGRSINRNILVGFTEVDFSISPLIDMGGIISIGDSVYFTVPPATTPSFAGVVQNIIKNYPAGINQMVVNTTPPGTVPISANDNYFFFVKNSVAESHGVLGHYCVFDISNGSSSKIELFTLASEVMKSFP